MAIKYLVNNPNGVQAIARGIAPWYKKLALKALKARKHYTYALSALLLPN
jgi:hypothetical protein